ncbi:MAG: Smr/MutS family protein [Deltaproteobacteria bacterium]|nr:Smr/MutS family protein [Deltaproteobacteria bacterium]
MARRKRRRAGPAASEDEEQPRAPQKKAPEKLSSPFAALKGTKVPKKKASIARSKPSRPKRQSQAPAGIAVDPSDREGMQGARGLEGYSYEDRVAFSDVFSGLDAVSSKAERRRQHKARQAGAKQRPTDQQTRRKQAKAVAEAAERSARAQLDRLVTGGLSFDVRIDSDGIVRGLREGAQKRTARMLGDGDLPPELSLDLHGFERRDVNREVNRFVRDAHAAGRRTVALIHGRGKHSEGGLPVLADAVVDALTEGGAAVLVEAFATAPDRFGGRGATLVRLRDR